MSASLVALLLYASWTLILVTAVAVLRTGYSMTGRRRANQFAPSGDDVSPFSGRLCRAHANCYENLPVFAAIVAVALLSDRSHVTDPLAIHAALARVAQGCVHLTSTRVRAVILRFVFFVVQIVVLSLWVVRLALSL